MRKNHDLRITIYDREHAATFCESTPSNNDEKVLQSKFKQILDILDSYKLTQYQDFGTFLKGYKFGAPLQKDIILFTLKYLAKNPAKNHFNISLSKRDLNKTDVGKRNIILTAISIKNSNELVDSFTRYIQNPENHVNIDDPNMFINGLKIIVNRAKNDAFLPRKNDLINDDQNDNIDTNQNNEISVLKDKRESFECNVLSTNFSDIENIVYNEDDYYFESFSDMEEEQMQF